MTFEEAMCMSKNRGACFVDPVTGKRSVFNPKRNIVVTPSAKDWSPTKPTMCDVEILSEKHKLRTDWMALALVQFSSEPISLEVV